ncbi:hypothetical protein HU230_0036840 [Bradyrhizobium quebecense]|uniref:hypothetical protein n=1 Tax=Bradyrhizobium quebecense TaxID=2748629 RepID=UPI001CD24BC7|nr:hypothetical protein [Bradyrhizobium quebecense]UGA43757.1 hypothetical protein HU230_0036840 [Bradyrhizobium quebecense]
MTTVFIAGSISINRLHKKVQERIGRIVSSDLDVVVGDADGADTSIQKCLHAYQAEKVTVYCTGELPRNNVANWPVQNVTSKAKPGSRAYFTAKDLEMARTSDYGLMIWDCKSTGTLSNVIELLRERKKSVVFVNKSSDFINVSDKAGLHLLLTFMSAHARAKAEEKINLSSVIASISQEQLSLDVAGNAPSSSSEKAKQPGNATGRLPMSHHAVPKLWTEDLAEARRLAAGLSASLRDKIEIAALGVRSKAPFQLLTVREALIWRTEELARGACDALERQDFTVAALLVRSIAESAAMTWYLLEILDNRKGYTPAALNDALMRMFAGSKNSWADGPEAINVLTFVKRLDKKIPGFEDAYNSLSEAAHPNWLGVSGLYSRIDRENFIVHYGRGFHTERSGNQLVNALIGGLLTFKDGYNKIADAMPAFLAELEKL